LTDRKRDTKGKERSSKGVKLARRLPVKLEGLSKVVGSRRAYPASEEGLARESEKRKWVDIVPICGR